ncbi:hypothetical protein VNO77_25109 [Canavalia gladiata]|uniref:BHLH domain-containing protein n=1 Tax=Canavalia gladiata TaxID=3824 RepID=A0AAN9QGV0_CANGL
MRSIPGATFYKDDYRLINESDTNLDDASLASDYDIVTALQEEKPQSSFSTESHCSYATFNNENTSTMNNSSVSESSLERLSKLHNIEHISQKTPSSPCSYILSFDNTNPPSIKVESASKPGTKVLKCNGMALPLKNEPKRISQESKKKASSTRSLYHAQDHIIAERMRREKISQQFIALSALIPNLKKADKASVLGDAIRYVKELKEQVKVLEEQSKRKNMESVMFVKKSQVSAADEDISETSSNSWEYRNFNDPSKTNLLLPEVEAKVSKKNVLIRIHCEKEKAMLENIFREIEKLHLSITNSRAFSFGSSVLVITIIAQMEDEFNMSVKELARNVRVGLMQ